MTGKETKDRFTDSPRVADVFRWLKGQGWQVGQSRLYQDAQAGKLGRDTAGNFTPALVNRYARTWLKRAETGHTLSQTAAALAEKKLRAEIELKQAQAERERYLLKMEKDRWVRRDQVENEQVGRAAVLDAGFDYVFRARVGELLELYGADPACLPGVIKWFEDIKAELLQQYARPFAFDPEDLPDDEPEE